MFRAAAPVFVAVVAGAAPAHAATLNTRWVEKQQFSSGRGGVTIYVRKIQITKTTWRAWVGVHNGATARVHLSIKEVPSGGTFSVLSGPSIRWGALEARTPVVRAARATAQPAYPAVLAPKKSWFGTFTGRTRDLPKDRLLYVGFGQVWLEGDAMLAGSGLFRRETSLATTHFFRLPKKL